MDRFRDPETMRELRAANAHVDEAASIAGSAREEVERIRNDLAVLKKERDHACTPIAPGDLLPVQSLEGIDVALQALDQRTRTRAQVLPPAEQRLAMAEKVLEGLVEERLRLASQVSPAQVVPEEIWIKIWIWADILSPPRDRPRFPFAISWVNMRWRAIILRSPIMWSHIEVSLDSSPQLLRLRIQRSGPCLLNVYLRFRTWNRNWNSTNGGRERLGILLRELSPCIHRWVSFHLGESMWTTSSFDWPMFARAIEEMLGNVCAPHLQHFCMLWHDKGDWLQGLFQSGAPSLSEVQLRGPIIRTNLKLLVGLTSLEMMGLRPQIRLSVSEFRSILEHCPALVHLGLDGKCFVSDSSVRTRHPYPVQLPCLRTLRLSFNDDSEQRLGTFIRGTFHVFSAPNLSSLCLLHLGLLSLTALIDVLERMPRAYGSQTLSLLLLRTDEDGIDLDSALATRMLQLFPHLQHLWLHSAEKDSRSFMEALGRMRESAREPTCASLHTLTLEYADMELYYSDTELYVDVRHNLLELCCTARSCGFRDVIVRCYRPGLLPERYGQDSYDVDRVQQFGLTMEITRDCETDLDCLKRRMNRAYFLP